MSFPVVESSIQNTERWVVCQLGARMHYAVPRMLRHAGKLERFHTDVYGGMPAGELLRRLPKAWHTTSLRRLTGRVADDLPGGKVRPHIAFGLLYYLRRTLARDSEQMSAVHLWAGRTFGSRVVKRGFENATAVYTYNTAALEILKAARAKGLFTVVEQTIVPRAVEDDLLKQEQACHPTWEPAKKFGPAAELTARRETEEWALADLIICGSEFVRNGIAQCRGPVDRCAVIPYGVDSHFSSVSRHDREPGPLRVLTVGELGLRKGASYCLEVARALRGSAEFRWVGPSSLSAEALAEVSQTLHLTGAVPRSDVRAHYEWADVFFLPSICEGSATVTYEALSCGLPVLTTPNAGSTVVDGETGFLAPIRDVQTMTSRLRQLHEDPALLKRMRAAAVEHSRDLSLEAYQRRLLDFLEQKFHESRGSAPSLSVLEPVSRQLNVQTDHINVTAIMTAYSREEKTLDSIQHVMKCRPAPAETLVHVDAGNEKLAGRIREQYPEVKVLLSHEHLGPGGSRNLLLQAATHSIVASFDDDSYPLNLDYFAVAVSEFEKHPHASMLAAAVRDIDLPEGPPGSITHRTATFVGCGCVYRRSAFLSTTGYVPLPLAYGMEEVDLSMRLHAQGAIILLSPKLVVQHNTDLRHRLSAAVNAAITSNAALLVFLRYPISLWPMGLIQLCKTVVVLIRDGRSEGILRGIVNIPAHLFRHRRYRETLGFRELASYIVLRRRYSREIVPA